MMTLGASALALGFLHGLGADHLMAIAALSIDSGRERSAAGRRARVIRTAVQFACGHMLTLGCGLCLALALGWVLPSALESGAERLGGGLLIALGLLGGWSTVSGRAYGHIHQEADGRSRWHLHLGGRARHALDHQHSAIPTIMGALFAISSLRAIVLLAPLRSSLTAMTLPVVSLLVLLFGIGILLSMSLFGVVLARVLSLARLESIGQSAGLLVAAASVALGVYWVFA